MKFHAILEDPGNLNAERVQQIHTNTLADVQTWAYGASDGGLERARGVLTAAVSPRAVVRVYEIVERELMVLPKVKM